MTKITIAPALSVLYDVNKTIEKAPGLMTVAADRRLRKVRPQIKADAKLNASQPGLPMIWSFNPAAQARARRWYFANIVPKGSKGGRYRRTGKTDAATIVTGNFSKNGGTITLENNAKGSEYVFGARQVPSFRGLHPNFDTVARKWSVILSSQLAQDWFTVTDPTGGVR